MGYALGCLGMALQDFTALTPEEFAAACKAHCTQREAESREHWEQIRTLAVIAIQPHLKKRITARQLLPLPWDKGEDPGKKRSERTLTREEQLRRFEELARKG